MDHNHILDSINRINCNLQVLTEEWKELEQLLKAELNVPPRTVELWETIRYPKTDSDWSDLLVSANNVIAPTVTVDSSYMSR